MGLKNLAENKQFSPPHLTPESLNPEPLNLEPHKKNSLQVTGRW